jgi:hypothetical protein
MKSIKFFALAVGAIALLPSVCLADNISNNSQKVNLKSVTISNGRKNIRYIKQSNIYFQKRGGFGVNVGYTSVNNNPGTANIVDTYIDVDRAIEKALNRQQDR